jgi:hypothetical protein
MLDARRPTERELRALRRMELSLRDFLLRHGEHPRWYWASPTNRMADEVTRLIADLDDSRHSRGAPPVAPAAPATDEASAGEGTSDEGGRGEEDDDEIFDDEDDSGEEEDSSPGDEE